jgi:hypothetical protein
MAEFLITLAQVLCICGLLYGAYLSIIYSDAEPPKKQERRDPVTTHKWSPRYEEGRRVRT